LGNKGFRIRHAYRFVFLHSCCGLTGGLPKAFGIDRKSRSIAHYNTKNVKPRAFVGATDEGSGQFDPSEYSELGQSLSIFFGMWMTEAFDVGECLDEAKTPETGRIELDEAFAVGGALDLRRMD
jgi:hypothetical protein